MEQHNLIPTVKNGGGCIAASGPGKLHIINIRNNSSVCDFDNNQGAFYDQFRQKYENFQRLHILFSSIFHCLGLFKLN